MPSTIELDATTDDIVTALLFAHGYFPWGKDAWIHEDDLGRVLDTPAAVQEVLNAEQR